jgi:hypothetical protein
MADDCPRCGALVIETEKHRQWHNDLLKALGQWDRPDPAQAADPERDSKWALVEVDSAKLARLVEDTQVFIDNGGLFFASQLLAKWAAMEFRPVPAPMTGSAPIAAKPLYEMLGLAEKKTLSDGTFLWTYTDSLTSDRLIQMYTAEVRPVYARRVRWVGSNAVGLDLVCRPLSVPESAYIDHGTLELRARRVWP